MDRSPSCPQKPNNVLMTAFVLLVCLSLFCRFQNHLHSPNSSPQTLLSGEPKLRQSASPPVPFRAHFLNLQYSLLLLLFSRYTLRTWSAPGTGIQRQTRHDVSPKDLSLTHGSPRLRNGRLEHGPSVPGKDLMSQDVTEAQKRGL